MPDPAPAPVPPGQTVVTLIVDAEEDFNWSRPVEGRRLLDRLYARDRTVAGDPWLLPPGAHLFC